MLVSRKISGLIFTLLVTFFQWKPMFRINSTNLKKTLKGLPLVALALTLAPISTLAAGDDDMVLPSYNESSTDAVMTIDPMPKKSAATKIMNADQIPSDIREKIYSKPSRAREITSNEVLGDSYFGEDGMTVVGTKVRDLEGQLSQLQGNVASLIENVNSLQRQNQGKAAQYYADVATISTQLQSGTTPGNPRLLKRLQQAEANLENLGSSVATLNTLANEGAVRASESSYLLEAARSAYGLSGAIEEDHVRLAELEDAVNSTSVIIDRLLNNISDDITRTSTYMSSERNNLRALAAGVNNGDLYGKSLGGRPFSNVGVFQASAPMDSDFAAQPAVAGGSYAAPAPVAPINQPSAGGPRPLVKIRFDRPDVNYEQPVYMAVNEALQRYPNATFDLVAVTPTQGNAAEVAIESTRSRRNAERVLRTLTQMGMDLERVNLSYSQSKEARSSEVHLYIR